MFYTYAWLREDGTPYYIGKGKGKRSHSSDRQNGRLHRPKDLNRIIYLKKDLTEEEAFRHERYMIYIHPNLHNLTEGGEGTSGYKHTPEQIENNRRAQTGKVMSAESSRKKSEAMKRLYSEGKRKMSPDHKQKLIDANHKRKRTSKYNDGLTPQQRYVLRNKEKVRATSREWARKNCGYNPDNYRAD